MRQLALLSSTSLFLAACASGPATPGAETICQEAAAYYQECTGEPYPAGPGCAGADQDLANEILAASCDEFVTSGGDTDDDGLVALKCFFMDVSEHSICLALGYEEQLRENGYCRIPRTLQAGIPDGGPCCNPGNCAETNDAGQALSCDTNSFLGLSGTCAPVKGIGSECAGSWICDQGLTCRLPSESECSGSDCDDEQCQPFLAVGDACADRGSSGCPTGSVCLSVGETQGRGTCAAPAGSGEPCESGDCADGLSCDPDDGVCTASPHCDEDRLFPCGLRMTCWTVAEGDRRCVPKRDTCESCVVDDDCGAAFNDCHPTAKVCYDDSTPLSAQCP